MFCRERLGVMALIPAKTRRYVAVARKPYRSEMAQTLGYEALGLAGAPEAQRRSTGSGGRGSRSWPW